MRLSRASRYFDKLPVCDGYTGELLFRGQFDLFDDSKRDATGVLRRVISTANPVPNVPRNVIEAPAGHRWLVGVQEHNDVFNDSVIRTKLVLQSADNVMYLRTPAEVVAGVGGTKVYAGLAWTKDWKEAEFGSQVYPYYEIYLGAEESAAAGAYLVFADKIFRARSVYLSEAGFKVAEADDLAAAVKALSVVRSMYEPVSDTNTETTVNGYGLVARFSSNFEYLQESAPKRAEGDLIVVLPKSTFSSVLAGDTVYLGGGKYRVLTATTEQDAWRLHIRP